MTPGGLLAEVTRRDRGSGHEVVESVHTGHLVLAGLDDEVVAIGDPEVTTFVRSAAKPLQTLACLGLVPFADHPSRAEVAVSFGSHRGESAQIAAVRRLLERSGTDPDRLTCPVARPDADPGAPPARILHNCSGKHAMFALAGAQLGVSRDRFLDPDAALQRSILGTLARWLGPPQAVGVDGCGAPAVAVPLVSLARAYAGIATDDGCAAIRTAGLAHPWLVGGEGRLESALLAAGVVAKVGAEGIYAVGWRDHDGRPRGLAVKAADGSTRGVAAATIAVLEDRGAVPPGRWRPPPPLGGDEPAGEVRAVPAVRRLAS